MKPRTIQNPNDVNWDEMLLKFSKHKGSIVGFCRKNNISHHHLYYRRKLSSENNVTKTKEICEDNFYKVPKEADKNVNKKAINITESKEDTRDIQKVVDIIIGKATIKVPVDHTNILSIVMKELIESC